MARGEDPEPLAGVPFGVKDLEDCAGMPTSKGSLVFKGQPPVEHDSVNVARMRAAGGVPASLTTTVADAARHLDVVAGPDERDRTSLPPPTVSYELAVTELEVTGLRARWSADLGFAVVDPEVAELAEAAAQTVVDAAGLRVDAEPILLTDPVWA